MVSYKKYYIEVIIVEATSSFVFNFTDVYIVDLQCCISFLLYSKVTQLHVYIFFPTAVYHRIMNTVSCAIQYNPVVFIY